MTEWVWCMPTIVTFHTEPGFLISSLGLDWVGIMLQLAVLRGCMVATVIYAALSTAIHE